MASLPFLFIAALFTLNPVTVDVYPPFGMAPASFRIRVMAPRHAANRAICYGVEGPELKRSCFTLEGAQAQRIWTVFWELRAPGEYEASATLTRIEDGREKYYRARRPFQVIGF